MSNTTNTQPTNSETIMDSNTNIVNIFNTYIENGGLPKVTSFKKHLDQLINSNIKSLCSSQGKTAAGGGWRAEQKAKFAGRGAKWVSVSIDEVSSTLNRFDEEGIDTSDYRTWIKSAGYAWIRYTGPRIVQGDNMAAFEVRTVGSTYDCPKTLHYIIDSKLSETIKPLNSTPHSMKLEVTKTRDVDNEAPVGGSSVPTHNLDKIVEVPEADAFFETEESVATQEEVIEEVEKVVNEAPTSDDPEEWEAYLESQGLGCGDMEDEDFDQLNDDMF